MDLSNFVAEKFALMMFIIVALKAHNINTVALKARSKVESIESILALKAHNFILIAYIGQYL